MNNHQISDLFSLLSNLLDINGENSFKAKAYSSAAFAIDKLPVQLSKMEANQIPTLQGIGISTGAKIVEILATNRFPQLEEMLVKTPAGVVEMLRIKGIGPKKIHTIWKQMELESIGELLYACKENRLKLFKGFGEKTQQSVINGIEYYLQNKGSYLFSQVISAAHEFSTIFKKIFIGVKVFVTGDYARQIETISQLEFVIATTPTVVVDTLSKQNGFTFISQLEDVILYSTDAKITIKIFATTINIIDKLIETSSSTAFFNAITALPTSTKDVHTEADYFKSRNVAYIPAYVREDADILTASETILNNVLQPNHIKGLIHCHSNWSDGNNTIEEMAIAARQKGMEYLVITDHSKTASYAQGLKEDQLKPQHQYIDELNEKLFPFKIFKSIESDILGDGSLDYSDAILSTFDLVVASIHSNLKMTEEKAMARLLAAIENKHTTILGHLTGRLLLSRPSYPLNFTTIIDACAANHVVIELNANPNRLDIDWREIKYALKKNVLISVNPDAHSITGIDDVQYGVFAAQKALLQPTQNLSSYSLVEFETYLQKVKTLKGL